MSSQRIVIKPYTNGVKKTLDELALAIHPYNRVRIENDFKEVTEGKVKKGKPRRSILSVCYIVALPNKQQKLSDLLEAFRIDQQSFVVGLCTYKSKFSPVDLTHMEVPKELSN